MTSRQVRITEQAKEDLESITQCTGKSFQRVTEDAADLLKRYAELKSQGFIVFYEDPTTGRKVELVLPGYSKKK